MECQHDGYHEIETNYDRRRGVLVFVWTCERCGSRLGEAGRQKYRPAFRDLTATNTKLATPHS